MATSENEIVTSIQTQPFRSRDTYEWLGARGQSPWWTRSHTSRSSRQTCNVRFIILTPMHLNLTISRFDHIIAAMTLQQPRFPLRCRPNLPSPPQLCFHDSPLYGTLPFASFIKDTGADEQICALLDTLRDITDATLNNIPYCHLLHNFKPPCPTYPIHKVLHAAGQIYAAALSSPSFFTSSFSLPWLQILSTNLDLTTSDPFWRENPGVRLWVLLVGAASAVERADRGYFMMYLARVSLYGGWENKVSFRTWCVLFSGESSMDSGEEVLFDESILNTL
jgi:hypothetical protein